MSIPWTENLVVPLISTTLFGIVVAVLWMSRRRLRRRVQQSEPPLAQEQGAISQEPVAPIAQAARDPPLGGPEAPADVQPITMEVEMDQPETPKQGEETQEEGAEPTESLLASIEQGEETQEEGAEPTDSLLAIFEQETVPDTEALSLVEGLED